MTEEYRNQVRLLLSVLPMVARQKDLPGVKWKLLNIRKMDQQKHQDMLKKLKEVISEGSTVQNIV